MNYLRTFVLVLLTVLLPIRGAVAAAMLCPGAVGTSSSVAASGLDHHDTHAGQGDIDATSATHDHSHGHTSDDSSSDAHASACEFCAGGCCLTPVAFASPAVESPPPNNRAAFPALTARVPAHYPDGQDRPPRTI